MASSPANCPKHETVPEQPTQTKKCSQGKRGKMKATSKAQGWQNGAEDIVPSPVDWEPVDDVDGPAYMNYKVIIEKERTPDLFPAAKGTMNFTGAIYAFSAGGVSLSEPRTVFLDTGDNTKLIMRVPQSAEDQCQVISYYSWDRLNFVYQSSSTPQPKQVFQLFTPANLGTHGAIAKDGEEISFTAKPQTNKAENIFTYFQIATGQNQEHITNTEETLGLYVDKSDWTVKATRDTSLWDKFKITSFATPATH